MDPNQIYEISETNRDLTDEEKIDLTAKLILERYREALEELAK